jgi:hypothetical protein
MLFNVKPATQNSGNSEGGAMNDEEVTPAQPQVEEKPKDAAPVDANPAPQPHEPGGPYDEEDSDKSFFQARYDVDETNEEGNTE